jgi:hemerythrin HHE cation binding domain-containing protein
MRDAGPADVIGVLKAQHAEIRRAFARAAMPGRERPAAFRRLVRLLSAHEAAEETHVHPTVKHIGSAAQAVEARLEEERRAKRLLVMLDRIGPDGDGYLRTLWALRRAVLIHAAREERGEFPALTALGRTRRQMLGLEVWLARYLAPTRPHPHINGMLANRIAMPVFGRIDRCRDLADRWLRRDRRH